MHAYNYVKGVKYVTAFIILYHYVGKGNQVIIEHYYSATVV